MRRASFERAEPRLYPWLAAAHFGVHMRIHARHAAAALCVAITITLESSCHSDSSSPVSVASVTLPPPAGSVNVGSNFALTTLAMAAHGRVPTGRPVAYPSSAPNVATVSCPGSVPGVAPGSAATPAGAGVKGAIRAARADGRENDRLQAEIGRREPATRGPGQPRCKRRRPPPSPIPACTSRRLPPPHFGPTLPRCCFARRSGRCR